MRLSLGHLARLRELLPVFIVAVVVALLSTLAGSVFDHVHKVDAEELTSAETTATPGPDGTQTLNLASWGLTLTAPLAAELPGLRYTTRPGDSVGLSSVDLEKQGAACQANSDGLGSLVRFPAGGFAASVHADPSEHFIATIADHDYAYQTPQNACSNNAAASNIVNNEESAIFASLDSLAPKTTP